MANLPENGNWEAGIYQIEETDLVIGGANGISNKQGKQLGNRTKYLYDKMGTVQPVATTVPGNITLTDADLLNKHQILSPGTGYEKVTLDVSGLPDGAVISLSMLYNFDDVCLHIKTQTGVSFYGVRYPDVFDTDIPLYNGDSFSFLKDGTRLITLSDNSGIAHVGDILYKACPPPLALEAKGQLVKRADYPRLWALVSAKANPANDYNWLWYPYQLKGQFSTGNGSTNFRLPDLRGLFLRGRDNGKGLDLDRAFPNKEGNVQKDDFKEHRHVIDVPDTDIGYKDEDGGLFVSGSGNTGQTLPTFNSKNAGGVETRPINAAYTAYIKY